MRPRENGEQSGDLVVSSEVFGGVLGTAAGRRQDCDLALGVLCDIHGGVRGADEAVPGKAVLGIEGEANAGRAMQCVSLDGKGLVEAALKAEGDFLDTRPAAR